MCPFFEKNPNSCPSVGWLFKGVQGLNVHISRAHKAEHLAGLQAKASQRVPNRTCSRILDEEIRLLAHAEFERRREYPTERVDMAQMLIDLGKTKRTYESVRKIRRAPKYKEFYAALGAAKRAIRVANRRPV